MSVTEELESFGGGIFATHLGIESRLTEAELWRAFEEPIVVWIHGERFDDSKLERLAELARKFPNIRRFRFTSTRLTTQGAKWLGQLYSDIPIERNRGRSSTK
jgi:hypothetical protein